MTLFTCSLHTGISMECVRWYILETMGIVPLHPDIVNGVHYIWVYWQNVFNDIFQRLWELCPYNLALFTVFITYRYIDRMCLSVYSRDHGNYSLLNAIIFNDVLTVHFFFLIESPTEWKVIDNIWKGFLKLFTQVENFHLTVQKKSPIEILKILIFNFLSVKTKIKDLNHDRLGLYLLLSFSSLSPSHLRSSILFSSHPKVCCLSSFFFLFFFSLF
jgi:hypothetical protein